MRLLPLSALALLLLPRAAVAAGYGLDIELLHPAFSLRDLPGVDSAEAGLLGSGRVGLLYQYEREPLLLYEDGAVVGEPIEGRVTVHLGGSLDLGRALSLRFGLPVAWQEGETDTELAANGLGFGDARLGARLLAPLDGPLRLGIKADLALPTGTDHAWLGERGARAFTGGLATLSLGPVDLLADAALVSRSRVDTQRDLVAGPELLANAGLRLGLWRRQVSVYGATLGRIGLSDESSLEGRTAVEALLGAQLFADGPLRLDLGAGRGLTRGMGTTPLRLFAGLTLQRTLRPDPMETRPVDPLAGADELPDERPILRFDLPDEDEELAPEPVWGEGELARVRVEEARIQIRDPIQFEYGTDHILPESLPTLRAVAAVLAEHPEIDALVIEGHASEEGSFLYNYDLAFRRAGAIFRELVGAGVHPYRLSTRSMGEVVPTRAGQDEASLATNRRVEFHIVHQRHPLEPSPPLAPVPLLPWDGTPTSLEITP